MHEDSIKWPPKPDPKCTCGKPIGIVIPRGEHIHPCSIHPDVALYGDMVTWS